MKDSMFSCLPNSWEVKKFENVGETIIGLTYSPKDVSEEGILVLRSSNIFGNRLAFNDNVYVNKNVKERLVLKEGDILICVRNGSRRLIGKSALIRGRAIGETFGAFMSVFRSDIPEYIFQVIQSDFIKLQIKQHIGATINQITNANLNSFQFPFPPIKQQKKIAQILSNCDVVLEQTEAAIAKYQALKKGLLHDLFTRGIDLTTGQLRPSYKDVPDLYKETELGFVPKEWEVEELNNYCLRISVGIATSSSKHVRKEGVLFLRNQNIKENFIDLSDTLYITREFAETNKSKYLKTGDVITVRTGYPGISAVVEDSLKGAQTFTTLITTPNPEHLNSDFLSYFINSKFGKNQIFSLQGGGAQQNLNSRALELMRMIKPGIEEQNLIVKKIKALDQKVHIEQQTLAKYNKIKAGLMQDLLSGKVGVEGFLDKQEN